MSLRIDIDEEMVFEDVWFLPEYKSDLFFEVISLLGVSLEDFRGSKLYKKAVQLGWIENDKWKAGKVQYTIPTDKLFPELLSEIEEVDLVDRISEKVESVREASFVVTNLDISLAAFLDDDTSAAEWFHYCTVRTDLMLLDARNSLAFFEKAKVEPTMRFERMREAAIASEVWPEELEQAYGLLK